MDFTKQQTQQKKGQKSDMDFAKQQTNTAKKGQKSYMDFTEQERNSKQKTNKKHSKKRTEIRSVSDGFHGARKKHSKKRTEIISVSNGFCRDLSSNDLARFRAREAIHDIIWALATSSGYFPCSTCCATFLLLLLKSLQVCIKCK